MNLTKYKVMLNLKAIFINSMQMKYEFGIEDSNIQSFWECINSNYFFILN